MYHKLHCYRCGDGLEGLREQGRTNAIVGRFIEEFDTLFEVGNFYGSSFTKKKKFKLSLFSHFHLLFFLVIIKAKNVLLIGISLCHQ